jgi:hypothetical protein
MEGSVASIRATNVSVRAHAEREKTAEAEIARLETAVERSRSRRVKPDIEKLLRKNKPSRRGQAGIDHRVAEIEFRKSGRQADYTGDRR